jgi:hypothetical protein
VRIAEFKREIKREFGANLEHATPANVREFLDRHAEARFARRLPQVIEINEPKTSYEDILRDFFVRVLDMPSDEAMILLWTMAFELSFYNLESHLSERLGRLFGEGEGASE